MGLREGDSPGRYLSGDREFGMVKKKKVALLGETNSEPSQPENKEGVPGINWGKLKRSPSRKARRVDGRKVLVSKNKSRSDAATKRCTEGHRWMKGLALDREGGPHLI